MPCFDGRVPCCVVRKSSGILKQAILICLGQLDSSLIKEIFKGNVSQVLDYCQDFTRLKILKPSCEGVRDKVPQVVHTVSRSSDPPFHIKASVSAEKGFSLHHVSDAHALSFIRHNCSARLAEAFRCLQPPAFRADLYRFCVLYAEGGIYLDADLVPLVPLRELYSSCSTFSLGYDQAQGKIDISHIGMQMKILAAAPRAAIAKCMLERIEQNVRSRRYFRTPFEFSGPQLLNECYKKYPHDVAITYSDTRGASWPYTGLRDGSKVLAYEKPDATRHYEAIQERSRELEYNDMVKRRDVYARDCTLRRK